MLAYDTPICIDDNCIDRLTIIINEELSKLNKWFIDNEVVFNIDKKSYIIFNRNKSINNIV